MKSLAVKVIRYRILLLLSIVSIFMVCSRAAAIEVDVYAFKCGIIKTQTNLVLKDTRVGTPLTIPITFYLIKHGSDWVAFDTGLNAAVAKDPFSHLGDRVKLWAPEMKPEDEFKVQIKKLGLSPKDIKAVIISHGHWDHAGAIENFLGTNVPIYFQRKEMTEIKKVVDVKKVGASYILGDFACLNEVNIQQVDGVFDLFGDKTIVAFPTPGHTVGHQSLYVKVSKGKPMILTADALYTAENLEKMIPPNSAPDMAALLQSFSIFKVMGIMGADVIPSHDFGYWEKVRLAPEEFRI